MTIYEVIERETGEVVTDETPLESLSVDSLEFLDLLLMIGVSTNTSIPDDKMGGLLTVGDIVRESMHD